MNRDPRIEQFHQLNTTRKFVKWLLENCLESIDKNGESSVDGLCIKIPDEFMNTVRDIRPKNYYEE